MNPEDRRLFVAYWIGLAVGIAITLMFIYL